MDPTNPEQLQLQLNTETQQAAQNEQGASDKSNVQKRIDELTAEKYQYAKQVEQLTATVGDLIKRQTEAQPAPQAPPLPEGVDPNLAKFFSDQIKSVQQKSEESAQRMFWQIQHQLDQTQVASKYAGVPQEILQDAAKRLTGLKQQYGQAANMDDAMKIAMGEYALKQMSQGRQVAFNNMGQPLSVQSHMPNVSGQPQQSTGLTPPTQLPNWDEMDHRTQNKLIDEYEKKGGRLL